VPIPTYVADAIEVWESVRPPHQKPLPDRKTHKPTNYLFQYRNDRMGPTFLNDSAIPLLCKLAGVSQTDIVGRITSHRARATTATWMCKMGMAPADIGKLLGHTNPARSLPWYMREDKHHLGRAHRKANPLERYVAAILDTNAHARSEPCVFYYLADGPDGRPRMCGNPHFPKIAMKRGELGFYVHQQGLPFHFFLSRISGAEPGQQGASEIFTSFLHLFAALNTPRTRVAGGEESFLSTRDLVAHHVGMSIRLSTLSFLGRVLFFRMGKPWDFWLKAFTDL